MEPKELESSIRVAMATSFIDNLPEDTKKEILASSMERTFDDLCSSYSMKMEIEAQLKEYANVYIHEYLQTIEVQKRLKANAHEAVDTVHKAVINSIITDIHRNMKSEYFNFVKEMEKGQ
jgi:hypothetical protein